MERAFKGVWIPAEIWLNNQLSIQEKVILTEIDSLDNEEGCFAGNKHFMSFMGLKERRIKELIRSLTDKGFIDSKIIYKQNSKEIEKRILRIKRPPYPQKGVVQKNALGVVQKNTKGGAEKCLDNNTNNNTNNICPSEDGQEGSLIDNFEKLWKIYPSKKGKGEAYKHYERWTKGKKYLGTIKKLTNREMWYAIKIYKNELQEEQKEKFTKNGSTFFNEAICEYSEKYNENREYWENKVKEEKI